MIIYSIEYEIEVFGTLEIEASSEDEAYSKYNDLSWQQLIDIGEKSEQYDIFIKDEKE
jgi:hypothetical protein